MVGLGTIQNGALNFDPALLSNPGLREAFAKSVLTIGPGRPLPRFDGARTNTRHQRRLDPQPGLPLHSESGADRPMRRILVSAAVLLAVGAFLVFTLGASGGGAAHPATRSSSTTRSASSTERTSRSRA